MSTFRNIIARRRPPQEGDAPSEAAAVAMDEPELPQVPGFPADAPRHGRASEAPPPPPELPRWEIEPPRRTIGEALAPTGEEEEDMLSKKESGSTLLQSEESEAMLPKAEDGLAARPRIWDLEASTGMSPGPAKVPGTVGAKESEPPTGEPSDPQVSAAPEPPSGISAPRSASGGRVKTRLLGFAAEDAEPDAFATERVAPGTQGVTCPIGWLVIVEGPGRGKSFALASGLSTLGRGSDQTICLDFGDDTISRDNHASIAYDEEESVVLVGHGGKSNLVRLNGKPLVSSEELSHGAELRLGKTTLRYVALCGPDFSWVEQGVAEGIGGDAGDV